MRSVLCLLALVVCIPPAAPATYTVLPDGSGDYPTIQAALDAAGGGDIVELGDGTFTGDGNRDLSFGGQAIHLRSASGDRDACVIDCQGSQSAPHRAFVIDSGEGSGTILEGFTITGGAAWRTGSGAPPADARGGGIYCSGASPVIRHCVLSANAAEFDGGALYSTEAAAPRLEDCLFTLNHASSGGGVLCNSDATSFETCTFTGNTARNGGALAWRESSVSLDACTFTGNTADVASGAISAGNASAPSIHDCTFTANAAAYGGAVTCYGGGTPTFSDCVFTGNSATGGGDWPAGCGAAIFTDVFSSPAITACTFHDNHASVDGGGLYTNGTQTHISGCTLDGNEAAGSGGGIYCDSDFPEVVDCLFKYNSADAAGGGIFLRGGFPAVNGCTFYSNEAADGGGVAVEAGTFAIASCTLQWNAAARGGGAAVLSGGAVTLSAVLIVSSRAGEAVACENCASIVLTCCDLYANEGGDWEGASITDQLGADGNISASPHFCYAQPRLYDDWSVHEDSPCAAAQSSCGLIGAWPADCSDTPVREVRWGTIKALFRR
jgi:predicted outer membrane repeat protein